MPAPLARGLIFSLSLLIAAGLAVYESPEFRAWVDDSRRKIATALHNFGDEIQPTPAYPRSSSGDASTREDNSPEAVERRRLARQEIMERARVMEERRRSNVAEAGRRRGASFDDLVDTDGMLKEKDSVAASTATDVVADEKAGLRNRSAEAAGAAMGAAIANPFADEAGMDIWDEKAVTEEPSGESTATLPAAAPLTIDTDTASTHPSELLIDLTPTTSVAPSTFPPSLTIATPTSESGRQIGTMSDYRSVHEWAEEASNASFYSPPESEAAGRQSGTQSISTSATPSMIGSTEHLSELDVLSEADALSDAGHSIVTPDSWTEVGSVVSEEGQ